ncbi:hypothetical protein PC9H_002711 [Pleurotus ostreatus]|uniref:Uncharacterized protein n=1 Tax=Pleurotus ostreatus TaxID=5322 RepID=A0A8H7DNJ8_PLEOS|nr:uncharacterized protein PC9H_002711 [Pleurotus ostreatus]KAF7416445.1 hypothetical protein PC9H_002711 [Pleurotus ostreatus]
MPPEPEKGLEIEYLEDGYMRREVLATEEEADEIALQAIYDELDMAHIAVTRTLSVGTSIVWLEVKRMRYYNVPIPFNVSLIVEFANSEECTRFLHENMRKLKEQYLPAVDTDVGVIGDIMRAVVPIIDKHGSAEMNAARRGIPYSQFIDEYQPETQLVRHRGPNRRHDRPCYLTLHLSITSFCVSVIDCGSTVPANFPSWSSPFHSLNNIHFNFPSSAPHDCPDHDRTFHNDTDSLSFTVEATGIHGLTATNSVAQGNSITIKSGHRNVHVNLAGLHSVSFNINIISGDSYFGAIHGGNVGGRNNVNTCVYFIITRET